MAKSDFLSRTRLFLEVLNEESLNQAAESLGKSTPQVSREIAKLEQELHVKLFTRLPTGIRVTREGAKFAEQILPLIERFDTLEESLIRETDQEINLFLPLQKGPNSFRNGLRGSLKRTRMFGSIPGSGTPMRARTAGTSIIRWCLNGNPLMTPWSP